MQCTKTYSRIAVGCTLFCLLLTCCLYIPNMGGNGLALPQNTICWAVMLLIALVACWQMVVSGKAVITPTGTLFIAGAVFLSLPLLWGHSPFLSNALCRFSGIWAGVMFYLLLSQFAFTQAQKRLLLGAISMAALLQCGLAWWQISVSSADNWMEFVPGERPYGIFQQANVLASFVATGYAIAMWYLVRTRHPGQWLFALAVVLFFTTTLYLLQSRAGILGAVLYLVLTAGLNTSSRSLGSVCAVMLGTTIIVLTLHLLKQYGVHMPGLRMLESVDKDGSNGDRLRVISTTLHMIALHPLKGWGYGSYEYNAARVGLQDLHITFSHVTHAHNEFLFEWAEGGVSAVAGMLMWLIGILLPLKKANKEAIAFWGLIIPIGVHVMTEYPLYQSTLHMLVLLLLIRLAADRQQEHVMKLKRNGRIAVSGVMVSLIAGGIFLTTGWATGTVLTKYERSGMQDFTAASHLVNPWIQYQRYQYDQNVSLLMQFNHTHNPELLKAYMAWGADYLRYKNDSRVFANLMAINHVMQDPRLAGQLKREWEHYYQAYRDLRATRQPLTDNTEE